VTTAPTLFTPDTVVPVAPAAAGPRPLVIGADLSLKSTGLGSADWTDNVRTKDSMRGHPRLAFLMQEIGSFLRVADFVVLEGPSYGHAGQGGHEELAGLRVMVQHWLWRREIPYAIVPPSSLKLFFAGYGKASKAGMREAAERWYGRTFAGPAANDECDGFALAAAGYAWLGFPLAEVPERHREALAGCQWPDREAVTTR
jgi:Holliday junction resolvasome RuvABC endonuclease subunit